MGMVAGLMRADVDLIAERAANNSVDLSIFCVAYELHRMGRQGGL